MLRCAARRVAGLCSRSGRFSQYPNSLSMHSWNRLYSSGNSNTATEELEASTAAALQVASEYIAMDESQAQAYAKKLSPSAQKELTQLFHTSSSSSSSAESSPGFDASDVSWSQLQQLAISRGVPLIGFGFMDNFIMIVAGEYIDSSIGVTLGISTMAAAALGNLFSDIAGLGLGGTIESLAAKLGIETPLLSMAQRRSRAAHTAILLGSVLGISIGCILGMFPLFFYEHDDHAKEARVEKVQKKLENKNQDK